MSLNAYSTDSAAVQNSAADAGQARIMRGDIYMCEFPAAENIDSEQCKERPVIVGSNNRSNENSTLVTVVPLTGQSKTLIPTHVIIKLSDGKTNTALCEQIKTVSKSRLHKLQDRLDRSYISAINKALAVQLAISEILYRQDISTEEALQKAEFIFKVADNFTDYADKRIVLNRALELVYGRRILYESEKPKPEMAPDTPDAPVAPEIPAGIPEVDEEPTVSTVEDTAGGSPAKGGRWSKIPDGHYCISQVAKLLEQKPHQIDYIVRKLDLKSEAYGYSDGKRFIFNEKAVTEIMNYLNK